MIDWRKELLDLRNDLQVRLGTEMRDIRHWTPFMLDVSSLTGSWSPSSGRGHPAPVSDAAVSDRGDQVVVEALDPQVMVGLTGQDALQPVADEAAKRLEAALASL